MPEYSVMISYSEDDENFARKVYESLRANGVQCWIGYENIQRAESWPASISRAIRQCNIFLLILTPNSNTSRQVVRELTEADRLGKVLYCYQTSDFVISDDIMYFFTSIQRLEAFRYEPKKAISILLKDIKENLAKVKNNESATNVKPTGSTTDSASVNVHTNDSNTYTKKENNQENDSEVLDSDKSERIVVKKWYSNWRILTPAVIILLVIAFLLLKDTMFPKRPDQQVISQTPTDSTTPQRIDTSRKIHPPADTTVTDKKDTKEVQVAPTLLSYYTYYNNGILYFFANDNKNAIHNFTKALELDKNHDSAYYFRGSANYLLDNYNDAISDFSRCIQLNTAIQDVFLKRGYCYFYSENYTSAITDFNKAITANNQDPQALLFRGYSYYFSGRYREALVDLSNAIKVNPRSGEAYYYKAATEEQLNSMDKACEDYKMSAELNYKKALEKVKTICAAPTAAEIIKNVELHVRKDRSDKFPNDNEQFAYHYYLVGGKKYLNAVREARYVRNHKSFWEYKNKTYQSSTDYNNNFDYKGYQWGNIDDTFLTIITKDGSVSETILKTIKYDN